MSMERVGGLGGHAGPRAAAAQRGQHLEQSTDHPLARLRGITKTFPGVVANDRIDLDVYEGEVHALLGENGAGKSTLISILAGMYRPDAGEIVIDGRPRAIDSPRTAIGLGIGTVYQHLTLVPTLSVIENLMLGIGARGGRLDLAEARSRFDDLAKVLGVGFSPDATVGRLALGQRQQVEIMKALWRQSRVLVLDEPTSMLTPQDYDELRQYLERLKADGLAIILITHKLHEAIEMGDRVSILRSGRKVGSLGPREVHGRSEDELRGAIVEMMFGDATPDVESAVEVSGAEGSSAAARRGSTVGNGGPPALTIRDVELQGEPQEVGLRGVTLELLPGQVTGVAGVDGNGQRELAEVMAGQRRPDRGSVLLGDENVTRLGVAERHRLGLRYVTDDRIGEGTVSDFDVAMNAVLKRVGEPPFWKRGRVNRRAIERYAQGLIEDYDVRPPDVNARIATLSGGNIQKLVLARELSFSPRVVIFNKPTYGLDVRTAEFVRGKITELADAGGAALLISTEIEELIALCDRIAVMSRGVITGVVDNDAGAEEHVGELMVSR
jgi:general nucleoside transport system ATP-binding protein